MNIFRKYYIPNLCISFTLVIICSSIWNIAKNNDPTSSYRFILEIVGVLCVVGIIDFLLNKIEFKKWLNYWILQGIVNYTVFFGAGYCLNWISFRISSILVFTATFLLAFLTTVFYTHKILKQDEELINKLLEQRNTKK
jgi:drug/metabolite transporter (DMT)-like permease